MRRVAAASVLSLVLLVLGAGGPSTPAGAQAAAPTVVVTPSTGLPDGHVVEVAGSGYPPSTTAAVLMCPPGAVDPFECLSGEVALRTTDTQGAFTTTYRVRRHISAAGGGVVVDCATVTCSVAVSVGLTLVARTPIAFDPSDPTLEVGPVVDGQVRVEGAGWSSGAGVLFSQCPSVTAPDTDCTGRDGLATWPGTTFSTTVQVDPELIVLDGGGARIVDCRISSCTIRARAGDGRVADAALDLSVVPSHPSRLVVAPSNELTDRSVVDVTGDGFGAGEVVTVRQCLPQPDAARECEDETGEPLLVATVDDQGGLTGSVVVRRDLPDVTDPAEHPTWVDCASTSCFLLVDVRAPGGSTLLRRAVVPIDLLDEARPAIDPRLSVAAASGPDGYTVTGTGFPLGGRFGLWVCTGSACAQLSPVVPDSDGTFAADVEIPAQPAPGLDCLVEQCTVSVRRVGSDLDVALAVLSEPSLELNVAIDLMGTLDADTGEAAVRALVTCGRTMLVDVEGEVAQPGAVGGFTFQGQLCAPGSPLQAFIPTRTLTVDDVPFTLGPADVRVTAVPVGGGSGTTVTGTTTLLDQGAVAVALVQAMAEPGATALRALFLSAVVARSAQDPVFAAAWLAALRG